LAKSLGLTHTADAAPNPRSGVGNPALGFHWPMPWTLTELTPTHARVWRFRPPDTRSGVMNPGARVFPECRMPPGLRPAVVRWCMPTTPSLKLPEAEGIAWHSGNTRHRLRSA